MNEAEAAYKTSIMYAFYLAVGVVSKTAALFFTPSLSQSRLNLKSLCNCLLWAKSIAPGLLMATLVYSLAQWEYLVNQFSGLTPSDGRLFTLYTVTGAFFANHLFALIGLNTCAQWLAYCAYLMVQLCILLCFYYFPSVVMIALSAFASGTLLMTLVQNCLVELQKYCVALSVKDSRGAARLFLASTGFTASLCMALFESLYYTNRDVTYWVTINNSAVPFILTTNALFLVCCSCLCQCCRRQQE